MLLSLAIQLLFICGHVWGHQHPLLSVNTTSGTVKGAIDASYPLVRRFLGVPYAEPPVRQLRWEPPVPKKVVSAGIDAAHFGPSCPQFCNDLDPAKFYCDIIPQFVIRGPTNEDCLFLSIWAPVKPRRAQHNSSGNSTGLPVIFWVHGGGLKFGGSTTPYLQPSQWVQRSQSHIVVQVNYRLNIFGFPVARALDTQNLGFLDQRLGLEWVRDNIAAFGGDPSRITTWGQSGGAISIDVLNFAYPDDPIASSLIAQSGTVSIAANPLQQDPEFRNFTYVASHFNCGNLTAQEELACLRKVPSDRIEAFINNYEKTERKVFSFGPQYDEKIVFSNYTDRYVQGKYSKIPAIYGTTRDESEALEPYNPSGPNQTAVVLDTLFLFTCPAVATAKIRYAEGRETFRFYYEGNFPNISPAPWMGAYHESEMPLLFGTHPNFRGDSTPLEYATSHAMQDLWVAFISDPINGLPRHGWPKYVPDTDTAIIFARGDRPTQIASLKAVDAPCGAF